jgi:hypothetical protein
MTQPVRKLPETWGARDEADLLGVSLRRLRDLITQHEPPVLRNGNRVLFDDFAHKALKEAMRCPPPVKPGRACTSFRGQEAPASICAAQSEEKSFLKALALMTPGSQKKPARRGRRSSSVLPFTAPDRRA